MPDERTASATDVATEVAGEATAQAVYADLERADDADSVKSDTIAAVNPDSDLEISPDEINLPGPIYDLDDLDDLNVLDTDAGAAMPNEAESERAAP
jgi:hypothetical protein